MRDKERILLLLVNRMYSKALFDSKAVKEWYNNQPGFLYDTNPLQVGDLVTAATTIAPNAYIVGYVHEIRKECVVIREIGSDRLCNYYNETFRRIDKKMLGYEILEGLEYKTYEKVCKAFWRSKGSYGTRFKSISFDGKICTVEGRKVFSDETTIKFSFKHSRMTTYKGIIKLINKELDKQEEKQ